MKKFIILGLIFGLLGGGALFALSYIAAKFWQDHGWWSLLFDILIGMGIGLVIAIISFIIAQRRQI